MDNAALNSLETIVGFLDEIDADDLANLPEDVASLLNYINIQARHVVQNATVPA